MDGTGTVDNILIEAQYKSQIFGLTLNVTNIQNDEVSVGWFGAKAEAEYLVTNGTDNLPIFNKAIDCFAITKQNPCIYIPAGTQKSNPALGNYYYFSGSLEINRTVDLYGASKNAAVLYFPASSGIVIVYPVGSCCFHDFTVRGTFGANSNTAHIGTFNGVEVKSSNSIFERIGVIAFDRNGWDIVADVGYSSNANLTKIIECDSLGNGKSGMYFQGGDVNACIIQGGNYSGNAEYGVNDEGFLGSTYVGLHIASNGHTHGNNKSIVSKSGFFYACIQQNVNIEPEVASGWQNYWLRIGYYPSFSTPWNSTTTYYPTGGMRFSNPNQQGVALGCYSEDDQPPTISDRTMVLGGFTSKEKPFNLKADYQGIKTPSMGSYTALLSDSAKGLLFLNDSMSLSRSYAGISTLSFLYLDSGQSAAHVFSAATPNVKGLMGRDDNYGGRTWFAGDDGFFSGVFNSLSTSYRLIGLAQSAPASGNFGVGDMLLNVTAGSEIMGWRCSVASVAGNGGAWEVLRIAQWVPVPASASSPGKPGQYSYDNDYYYVCVGVNTWKRTALSSW